MIAICKRRSIVAIFAAAVTMSCATSAFSAETFSFPPTSFEILNPATGAAMGRARYRIEWDDGRTSVYTPAAGALRLAPETAKRAG